MNAAPQFDFPQPKLRTEFERPELGIHQPDSSSWIASEDPYLAAMLACNAMFLVGFASFLLIPHIGQWLAL